MSERRRRRGASNEMVTIYWRDIPAQVKTAVDRDLEAFLEQPAALLAANRRFDLGRNVTPVDRDHFVGAASTAATFTHAVLPANATTCSVMSP